MVTVDRRTSLPDALREPVRQVSAGWISRLSLNLVGMWIASYAPLQVLLGLHAAALAPAAEELVCGIATAVGGLCSLVANPLVGALSDRTTVSSRGRSSRRTGRAAAARGGAFPDR